MASPSLITPHPHQGCNASNPAAMAAEWTHPRGVQDWPVRGIAGCTMHLVSSALLDSLWTVDCEYHGKRPHHSPEAVHW